MSEGEGSTARAARTITSPTEALAVTALCFGWAILSSIQAVARGFESRGFSDAGLINIVVFELMFGAAALGLLRWRGYGVATLRPVPNWHDARSGVVLYLATLVVHFALVLPFGSDASSQPIDRMVETATVSWPAVVLMAVVNGTYEEIFLLGFLLRGLRGYGLSVALGASLLVRVLYHLYQGPVGALSVLGFGLVLGLAYVRTGRLFPVVVAHVVADIVPFLLWPSG